MIKDGAANREKVLEMVKSLTDKYPLYERV